MRQAVVLQGVRMVLVHSQRYLMRSQRSLKVASLREYASFAVLDGNERQTVIPLELKRADVVGAAEVEARQERIRRNEVNLPVGNLLD